MLSFFFSQCVFSGPLIPRDGCWLGMGPGAPDVETSLLSRARFGAIFLLPIYLVLQCGALKLSCPLILDSRCKFSGTQVASFLVTLIICLLLSWISCCANVARTRYLCYAFISSVLLLSLILSFMDPIDEVLSVLSRRIMSALLFATMLYWLMGKVNLAILIMWFPGMVVYFFRLVLSNNDSITAENISYFWIAVNFVLAGMAFLAIISKTVSSTAQSMRLSVPKSFSTNTSMPPSLVLGVSHKDSLPDLPALERWFKMSKRAAMRRSFATGGTGESEAWLMGPAAFIDAQYRPDRRKKALLYWYMRFNCNSASMFSSARQTHLECLQWLLSRDQMKKELQGLIALTCTPLTPVVLLKIFSYLQEHNDLWSTGSITHLRNRLQAC